MKVRIYGNEIECAYAIRGTDYVQLRDENKIIISEYKCISDFSGYEILDGEWTEEKPEVTDAEQLRADIDYIAIMTGVEL